MQQHENYKIYSNSKDVLKMILEHLFFLSVIAGNKKLLKREQKWPVKPLITVD
jgi:hypothetical protein